MKTVVLTSDNHTWLLHGFFHQWAKYSGVIPMQLQVAGFTHIKFLPKYASFFSIGDFADYPVNAWSDGLIRYLSLIPDDLVLILLEDYWLMRPINQRALSCCTQYMTNHPDVIRFDVAADRMFNRQAKFLGTWGSIDVCEAKGDYSLSFQASIFRRKLLLELLVPGESPWQAEINGSGRLNNLPYRVCGSYQWPIMYMITVNKGKFDPLGQWMYPARSLSEDDWTQLRKANCLPDQLKLPEVIGE